MQRRVLCIYGMKDRMIDECETHAFSLEDIYVNTRVSVSNNIEEFETDEPDIYD